MTTPLRISACTLNLWGTHGPVERRVRALVEALAADRPDLLLLQEVERHAGRSQAEAVAEGAGYDFFEEIRTGRKVRGGEGLAVCSVAPLEALEAVPLPDVRLDAPRAVQLVDVVLPDGRRLRVGNTHLAWRLRATAGRVRQANAVVEALRGWYGPLLVGGDLNDTPGSPPLRTLTIAPLRLVDASAAAGAAERPTFDAANAYMWQHHLAGRRVDHLLVRGFDVVGARLAFDGRAEPVVSDHYGVRVELLLPGVGV